MSNPSVSLGSVVAARAAETTGTGDLDPWTDSLDRPVAGVRYPRVA